MLSIIRTSAAREASKTGNPDDKRLTVLLMFLLFVPLLEFNLRAFRGRNRCSSLSESDRAGLFSGAFSGPPRKNLAKRAAFSSCRPPSRLVQSPYGVDLKP